MKSMMTALAFLPVLLFGAQTDLGRITVGSEMDVVKSDVQYTAAYVFGSNVTFSVVTTNYLSGAYLKDVKKLTIREVRNGVTNEIYDSYTDSHSIITNALADFERETLVNPTNGVVTQVNVVSQEVVAVYEELNAVKADKAWGQYTSIGDVSPSNTITMVEPNVVFAGGTAYRRIQVGEGAIGVLTVHGAPAYVTGDEGTFRFQDEGGTNYFGFSKSDSYVIGCDTDAISVDGATHIVTLGYNVTMTGVPCIWWRPALEEGTPEWEQLNNPDGSPVPGASHVVSWETAPPTGKEICYIDATDAKGFYKATIEVKGANKFETNMPADLSGGIYCTDGIHKARIDWNGGSPRLVPVVEE